MGVSPMPAMHAARPTFASVASVAGCPSLDSERLKPPQTRPKIGAVKFPHTMAMHMLTIHTNLNSWS